MNLSGLVHSKAAIFAGVAALGLGAIVIARRNASAAQDAASGDSGGAAYYPLTYASAGGGTVSTPAGQSSTDSYMEDLLKVQSDKNASDAAISLKSLDVQQTLGLAGYAADTAIALDTNKANELLYMSQALQAQYAASGENGLGGNLAHSGLTNVSGSMSYVDGTFTYSTNYGYAKTNKNGSVTYIGTNPASSSGAAVSPAVASSVPSSTLSQTARVSMPPLAPMPSSPMSGGMSTGIIRTH